MFTSEQALEIIKKAWPPETTIVDLEEIETYVFGPDDPEGFFATFESEEELIKDFEVFINQYERG